MTYVPLEKDHAIERRPYQWGTWIEITFPYAEILKARVRCSDDVLRRTHTIGGPSGLGIVRANVKVGGINISGEISVFTRDGEATADPAKGVVMFRANPNGANAHLLPVGWYFESYASSP